jgi:hypothetical protein
MLIKLWRDMLTARPADLPTRLLPWAPIPVLLLFLLAQWTGPWSPLADRAILRAVHLYSLIVFLGNIYAGLIWSLSAERSNSIELRRFALRGTILSHLLLNFPSVLLLIASGTMLADQGSWGHWSIRLTLPMFWAVGLLWLLVLIPYLLRMDRELRSGVLPAPRTAFTYYAAGFIVSMLVNIIYFMKIFRAFFG